MHPVKNQTSLLKLAYARWRDNSSTNELQERRAAGMACISSMTSLVFDRMLRVLGRVQAATQTAILRVESAHELL